MAGTMSYLVGFFKVSFCVSKPITSCKVGSLKTKEFFAHLFCHLDYCSRIRRVPSHLHSSSFPRNQSFAFPAVGLDMKQHSRQILA